MAAVAAATSGPMSSDNDCSDSNNNNNSDRGFESVESEAAVNATLLLQKQLFDLQTKELTAAAAALHSNSNALSAATFHMPEFLQLRKKSADSSSVFSTAMAAENRTLDNEELTMLSLLDSEGKLSLSVKMEAFMVLMTRIRFSDHRILTLHLLTHHLTTATKHQFVQYGGYKLLERWLQAAKEVGSVAELRSLIRLCSTLPFDVEMARQSGIGKAVNKLHVKLKGMPQQQQQQELTAAVGELLRDWKKVHEEWKAQKQQPQQQQQQQEQSYDQQQLDSKTRDLVDALADRISSSRSTVNTDTTTAATTAVTGEVNRSHAVPLLQTLKNAAAVVDDDAETADITAAPAATATAAANVLMRSTSGGSERKPLDFVETAKKMAALQKQKEQHQQQQQQSTAAADDAAAAAEASNSKYISSDLVCSDYGVQNLLKLDPMAKPLPRGGLKRPRPAEESSADNNNNNIINDNDNDSLQQQQRKRRRVRVHDEHDNVLLIVHIIEVDRIKKKVKEYASTKELSKREKMEEKKAHTSKINDAMQPTTTWRSPAQLLLPLEVVEFSASGADSDERLEQKLRLEHVITASFFTDAAIPSDPYQELLQLAQSNSSAELEAEAEAAQETILWYSKDTLPPAEDFLDPLQLQQLQLQQQQRQLATATVTAGGGALLNSNSAAMPPHYLQQQQQQQQMSAAAASANAVESELQSLIADLPLSLQQLDPHALHVIITNPTILQSLLRADGSVDDDKVRDFQRQVHHLAATAATSAAATGMMLPPAPSLQQQKQHHSQAAPAAAASMRRRSRWNDGNNNSSSNSSGANMKSERAAYDPQEYVPSPQHARRHDYPTASSSVAAAVDGAYGGWNRSLQQQQQQQQQQQRHFDYPPPPPLQQQQQQQQQYGVDPRLLMHGVPHHTAAAAAAGGDMLQLHNHHGGYPMPPPHHHHLQQQQQQQQQYPLQLQQQQQVMRNKGQRFPSTKAATPCRFYNTSNGCQFGDKCEFGHFDGVDSAAAAAIGGSGGGPGRGRGGRSFGPGRGRGGRSMQKR